MDSKSSTTDMCFDEILQCSICMELIADPRALPCLHSYCYKCISSWCSGKKPDNPVACPLCRKEFAIPSGGVENLQKNFFIANLLNLNQLKGAETTTKLCDVCGDVEDEEGCKQGDKSAKMFCTECQQRMCKSCSTVHAKMRNSTSHKLVSLDEISTGSDIYSKYQSLMCDKHADKKVEVFCFECKTTLCMMCYIKDHSSHKCSDVAEVAGGFRVDLKKDIQLLTATMETYDTNLAKIKLNGIDFSNKAKEVEAEISRRADQLHAEIEAEKRKLVDDLNATVGHHKKEITNATDEISWNKSLVQRLLNYCCELLHKGSDYDIAREASSLHTRAEELVKVKTVAEALKDVSVVDVTFFMSGLTYSHPESILGIVAKKGGAITLLASLQVEAVSAMACLDDELFVSHVNGCGQVTVYDSVSLELKRQIQVQGMSQRTTGLATCSTNKCLYVSDLVYRRVFRLDISTLNSTSNQTQWHTSAGCPGNLSVTGSDHNVLVAYEGGIGLEEYSPTGTLIRSLFMNSTIYQAIELNKDTLVISKLQPVKSICKTSKDGNLREEFKNMPNENCCLAVDSYGNIFFPDTSNNIIQVVNASLTSVRTLPLPADISLKSPFALCYEENSRRLYVGGGNSSMNQFNYHQQYQGNTTRPEFQLLVFDAINFW